MDSLPTPEEELVIIASVIWTLTNAMKAVYE